MAAVTAIETSRHPLARLGLFEAVLTAFLMLLPAALLALAGSEGRDSISAYYDMKQNQIFYYGLTVAAMLFLANGVANKPRKHNLVLGGALSGVILFNHDAFPVAHSVAAWTFFLGGAVVIVWFSSGTLARRMKPLLVGLIIAALAGHFWFGVPNFFTAEWAAMIAIAFHFILDGFLRDETYQAKSARSS